VVGLTNDDPQTTAPVFKTSYTLCGQYNGSVAANDKATVVCAPSAEAYRYVIVHGAHDISEHICLTEVDVYESKRQSHSLKATLYRI